jgi:hypothetical protein
MGEEMGKKLLILLLCTLLFLTACGRTQPNEAGNKVDTDPSNYYEVAYYPYDETYDPIFYLPVDDADIYFNGQEDREEIQHAFDPLPLKIFHDFFVDNFTIIDYEGLHGAWQLWGHSTQGEVRLMKQIYLNLIDGFEYPVLVLVEYTLEEDGIGIIEIGLYNAYLIRDGIVCNDLSNAEFNAIFREVDDFGIGWFVITEDGFMEAQINGENVFFHDFAGDVRVDGSMERVLAWLLG